MESPRTAVIYCRISLDKHGTELGVQRQEEECRRFCEARGLEVLAVHVDNDMSATKGLKRPGLEAMYASTADVWVTWATDRLVRKMTELQRIIDHGVTVLTVQAGPIDLTTPSGTMVAQILTSVAQMEGAHRTARQQLALRQRANQGKPWWPVRPFGFEMDGTHRDEEAELIRQGYADFLRGSTLTELAQTWSAAGAVTSSGKAWSSNAVRQVLKASRNAGLRSYHGEILGHAAWPAIVGEPLYRAALNIFNHPDRRRSSNVTSHSRGRMPGTLLALIATCVKCGSPLVGGNKREILNARGERVSTPTYMCRDGRCQVIPRDFLESVVLHRLADELPAFAEAWPGRTGDDGQERALVLRAEQAATRARMADLGERFARDELPMEVVLSATRTAQARLEEIDTELASLTAGFTVADVARDPEYIFQAMTDDLDLGQQRALLGAVFEEIRVTPRGKGNRELNREIVAFKVRGREDRVVGWRTYGTGADGVRVITNP